MRNELIAARQRQESVIEIPSYQTLKEGVYWRARVDIDLGNKYVLCEDGCRRQKQVILPAGQVHLLLNLHFVDDEIHSVTLHYHPGDANKENHRFRVKDFLDQFEPAYDGEAVRQRELAEVQQAVLDVQNDLAAGPKDEVIISALLEEKILDEEAGLPTQTLSTSTNVGELITQNDNHGLQLEKIQRQIRNQQAIVKKKADWMTAKSAQLSATIQKMTPYFAEKSAAALAACQESLSQHDKILKAVANLELYTLKDVEVQQLCCGESAAEDEPIWLFQRKLFLDEETLIHHLDGGADYRSLSAFAKELDTSESLRDRLIPCRRGAVTIQWRRHPKHYSDNPLENAYENIGNFTGFILVRDGENFYMVFSKLVTESVRRMFPTQEEMNNTFKGWKGDISFQDIEFSDARNRHDNLALHYKRMLLLLWGLQDSKKLFGKLKLEEDRGQLNWFSYQVQTELLHLVYDDERGSLLGEGMPPIATYVAEKNNLLQSGSRVITDNHVVVAASPGAARCGASTDKPSGVYIAYRSGSDILVDIPVSHRVYTRDRWKDNYDRRFNTACNLSKMERHQGVFAGYLCLDAVKPEDIDYYLNSRDDREYYLRYINLFLEAKKHLESEREAELDFIAACRRALVDGNIVNSEENVDAAIANGLRNWRATNNGAAIPSPEANNYKGCFEAVIGGLYIFFGAGQRDRETNIVEMLAAEGRAPLRMVVTGASKIVVYATLTAEEEENILGYSPWVQAITVEEKKTKMALGSRKIVVLPEVSASETVVKEWPDAKLYAGKEDPHGFSYQEARNLVSQLGEAPELMATWFATHPEGVFEELLEKVCDSIDDATKGKTVERTDIIIPLMLLRYRDHYDVEKCVKDPSRTPSFKHVLVYWRADSLTSLYIYATPSQRKIIEGELGDIYQKPGTHRNYLREAAEKPCEFGDVRCIEIDPSLKKFRFGGLHKQHHLRSLTPKFVSDFDFTNPSDRATIGIRSFMSYNLPSTYEVVTAVPVSAAMAAIIKTKTLPTDDERYDGSKELRVTATLGGPSPKTSRDGFPYDEVE